jgi:hypothetical protein
MPNQPPGVSEGYNSTRVDLSAAPGAEQDWDQIFASTNPEVTPQQPQVVSQPQQQADPFLKAGATVYNTAEDAVNGTIHKDDLIAKYRSFLTENGVDPNTMRPVQAQPVQQQPQPEPQRAPSPYKYLGNPDYFEQVADAATKRDKARYEMLMAEHAKEAAQMTLQNMLQPWAPILAETTRQRAIRQVSSEVPDFNRFIESPGYKQVLDTVPIFREMVQIGENDPVAAQRLPEVYKSMYLMYQGLTRNAAPQGQPVPQTQPQPVRQQPTLQPSALTPPPPGPGTQGWEQNDWRGARQVGNEARKQLIADGDKRFAGARFEDIGL